MEIRSIESSFQENDNIIEGYAIRFNSVSEILYDKEKRRFFREIIDREAITQELIDNSDIKFLFNHDKERLLARRNKGTGSLHVEVRDEGVYFSFEILFVATVIARAIIAITEVVKTTLTLFPVYANFPLFCPTVSINFPALL